MKKGLIAAFSILTVSAVALTGLAYKKHRREQCQAWLQTAKQQEKKGYYANAIETLTLYFSEDDCRSSTDPAGIKILNQARPFVPTPGSSEVKQQLMLARFGQQLINDNDYQVQLASASLAAGDWRTARLNASRIATPEALLIEIAASIRLRDWAALEQSLDKPHLQNLSEFRRALIIKMLKNAPVTTNIEAASQPMSLLAEAVLFGRHINSGLFDNPDLKRQLTSADLATASILLVAAGHQNQAAMILDQPERALPYSLLRRLARLLWTQKRYHELITFNGRSHAGALPADILLTICMAQRELRQACEMQLDQTDYEQRYGIYAARLWGALLGELSNESLSTKRTLDALAAMKELIASDPVANHLAAVLYTEIGELDLARRHVRQANLFGMKEAGPASDSPAQPICDTLDDMCLSQVSSSAGFNPIAWQYALAAGYKPSAAQIEHLRENSPDEAILWRLAKARAALAANTDKDAARSLKLVQPVLEWSPDLAPARLIAASGYAYFQDYEASYGHLMTAVKANPDSVVAALRLSLHFFENNKRFSRPELVRWWTGLTRLELVARSLSDQKNKLLIDRLTILAAKGEQENDTELAMAAYRSILQVAPNHHVSLNNLSVKYLQQNTNLAEARLLATKAVELNPDEVEYQLTLKDIETEIERRELSR